MRRPLGELLVLDLETMQWSRPETQGAGGDKGRAPVRWAERRSAWSAARMLLALRCWRAGREGCTQGHDACRACRLREAASTCILSLLPSHRCSPSAWRAGTPPGPRSAHAAAVFRDRYLLIFGGGSVAHCNDELHCLDTQTMEWSQPEFEGPVPPPRAGEKHACTGVNAACMVQPGVLAVEACSVLMLGCRRVGVQRQAVGPSHPSFLCTLDLSAPDAQRPPPPLYAPPWPCRPRGRHPGRHVVHCGRRQQLLGLRRHVCSGPQPAWIRPGAGELACRAAAQCTQVTPFISSAGGKTGKRVARIAPPSLVCWCRPEAPPSEPAHWRITPGGLAPRAAVDAGGQHPRGFGNCQRGAVAAAGAHGGLHDLLWRLQRAVPQCGARVPPR